MYKLENTYENCSTYNGYELDNRWNELAATTDYQLLFENGIWNLMLNKPYFNLVPQDRSEHQSIYYRSYIPWSPSCRAGGKTVSRSDIIHDSNEFSSSVSSYLVGLIVLSVIFVAFGIFTLVLSCIRKCAPFS